MRNTPEATATPDPLVESLVCPWRDGKRWVYSITFDEALIELHQFVVPVLEKHGVPGHLEAVAGHIGIVRQIGNSSYNGFRHMSGSEMRDMISRGWGVGNHSYSHGQVNAETAETELGQSKRVLEEAIGEPITIYCAPGDNQNMNEGALAACRKYGYLGAMSITDALNRPNDPDLLWMNRTFLHEQGYGPFYSAFDPFRNIALAQRDHGWIIDYCHCPMEKCVHPNKDCSAAQLQERIETIVSEGADQVWLARVEEAVDYRYTRRHTKIEKRTPSPGTPGDVRGGGQVEEYALSAPGLPDSVRWRTLTLRSPKNAKAVEVDKKPTRLTNGLFDVEVSPQPKIVRIIQ
ncbi:MAG TPA: polysaccharide deacetylase family protein [Tepidisphaeraceae bacterium]|nr:polysaccharide deacetylase family protein [Tepidisphaeraceae bacterium]